METRSIRDDCWKRKTDEEIRGIEEVVDRIGELFGESTVRDADTMENKHADEALEKWRQQFFKFCKEGNADKDGPQSDGERRQQKDEDGKRLKKTDENDEHWERHWKELGEQGKREIQIEKDKMRRQEKTLEGIDQQRKKLKRLRRRGW